MLTGLFAQPAQPAAAALLVDAARLLRFYREAPRDAATAATRGQTALGDYLEPTAMPTPFVRDHLLPMAAAIWSASGERYASLSRRRLYPLLRQSRPAEARRAGPPWRTVIGGSRDYVERLTALLRGPHPRRRGVDAHPARLRAACRSSTNAATRSLRPCRDHRGPRRSGAGDARRSDGATSARCSARSAIAPTSRCCTPTRR